jgi:hypothetical protein
MPGRIRVLDAANRTMQRLGYLKALCVIVNETETSTLASLGKRLLERVTKKVRLSPPFDNDIRDYVQNRLTDNVYHVLRKQVLNGTNPSPISLELQDVYLADGTLPSRTGKLVEANWRRYPYLGTSLELIKKGTYSALTRSLVLLALTPVQERIAFSELDRQHNPLRLSEAQSLLLLYCLIDSDGDVLLPLYQSLIPFHQQVLTERVAGDLLPDIFRKILKKYQGRGTTAKERDRLALLGKTASSIEKWKQRSYTGGGAREESIRVRLEPFCDFGFLRKPNVDRYEYLTTEELIVLISSWEEAESTESFLQQRFFRTYADAKSLRAEEAEEEEIVRALADAGRALKSSLGYSPITDVGLLAAIRLFTEKRRMVELAQVTELLKSWERHTP